MSFLVPAGVAVTPEPETPTPFPQPVDPGAPQVTWIAPDGTVWPLTTPSLGWHTLDAVTGWGAAPKRITTRPHPRGGVRVSHIQPQARYITWPLRVEGSTHLELVGNWRRIVDAFEMTDQLGPGRLQVARPDGTRREILAYSQEGFDGSQGQGHTYDTAVLTLLCEDPYWRDVDETAPEPWAYVATVEDFLDPYPTVSSGQTIDGGSTVFNAGEIEAWPVWTITGPMTSLLATNLTTGEEFTLTATLADDTETATVDTYAGTVTGPDGTTSWFGFLNQPGAVLWGLAPGENQIEFTMGGANVGSQIAMTWRNRWRTS